MGDGLTMGNWTIESFPLFEKCNCLLHIVRKRRQWRIHLLFPFKLSPSWPFGSVSFDPRILLLGLLSTAATVCFLLTNGLAVRNTHLGLGALRADSLVRRATSINFEKDENVRFSRKTLYSPFMTCRHTLTNTSSSTGSTRSSALSWNLFTYRLRSLPAYCLVRPN